LFALMKLLLLGHSLLPLKSSNSLIFLINLETLEIFVNFGLLEFEVNANLSEFFLLKCRGYEMLYLLLLTDDKVVLVLSKLLFVFRRVDLTLLFIFRLLLLLSLSLRLLIYSVPIAPFFIIPARSTLVVSSIASSLRPSVRTT
jgi:hypothetical protein